MGPVNKDNSLERSKPEEPRRGVLDILLLLGSALLLTALLAASFLLSERYRLGEFWVWGSLFGALYVIQVARSYRSKLTHVPLLACLALWLIAHLLWMLVAATRLAPVTSVVSVALELWVGTAITFWLFGIPLKDKKQNPH